MMTTVFTSGVFLSYDQIFPSSRESFRKFRVKNGSTKQLALICGPPIPSHPPVPQIHYDIVNKLEAELRNVKFKYVTVSPSLSPLPT